MKVSDFVHVLNENIMQYGDKRVVFVEKTISCTFEAFKVRKKDDGSVVIQLWRLPNRDNDGSRFMASKLSQKLSDLRSDAVLKIEDFNSDYENTKEDAVIECALMPWLNQGNGASDCFEVIISLNFNADIVGSDFESYLCDRNDELDNCAYELAKALARENDPEWDQSYIGEMLDASDSILNELGIYTCHPWFTSVDGIDGEIPCYLCDECKNPRCPMKRMS